MADSTLTALTAASALGGTELLYVVQGGADRKATPAQMKTFAQGPKTISAIFDGGGSALTTGIKGDIEIPFACTINAVTMLADQSGSLVVDIWKSAYSAYPPVDAGSITASAVPTISAATKSQNLTLTGWTTAIAAGDILRFNIDSITTITRCTLSLKVTPTGA